MNDEEKRKIVLDNGWLEYHGDTFVKKVWVDKREPYDRMATSLESAFRSVPMLNYTNDI